MDKQLFDRIYDFITDYPEFAGIDFSLDDLLDRNVDSVGSLIDFMVSYLDSSDYTIPYYHTDALDILKERDTTLQYSLGLASDMGIDLNSLDSIVLASLILRDDCDIVLYSEGFRQGLEEIFAEYSE